MSEQPSPYSRDSLRPTQRAILDDYNGGRMGISAVPGSGKTYTLSMLAADIILSGDLDLNQEILIVTLSNSAVDNFSQRIGAILEHEKMLPGLGYRVRTLHGLAHDIVRERPGLLNLANDFSIIDEVEANTIREQIAVAWLRANPYFFDAYFKSDLSDYQIETIRGKDLSRLVQSTSNQSDSLCERQRTDPRSTAETIRSPACPASAGRNGLRDLPGIPTVPYLPWSRRF